MTITRLGATKQYAANWGKAFRKESAASGKAARGASAKRNSAAARRKSVAGKN